MSIVKVKIGLLRLRGGALSQDAEYGGISQQDEEVDLKFIQCGFESHYPYHKGANSNFLLGIDC